MVTLYKVYANSVPPEKLGEEVEEKGIFLSNQIEFKKGMGR